MATKTIGLREDVYERLKARKHEDESFSDLVDRLLAETIPDWRDGFGSLPRTEGEELERAVKELRTEMSHGFAKRQGEVLEELADEDEDVTKTA